jgi:hypothetical protein
MATDSESVIVQDPEVHSVSNEFAEADRSSPTAEVREMTLRDSIFARSVIRESVMPMAKYSCSGSLDKFSSGNTATDLIGLLLTTTPDLPRLPPKFNQTSMTAARQKARAPAHTYGRLANPATRPRGRSYLSTGTMSL